MELIAAGAEELATGGVRARADLKEGVAAVFVVFDRKALKKRLASGAGSRGELAFHEYMIARR
jgi:hypothetical protein